MPSKPGKGWARCACSSRAFSPVNTNRMVDGGYDGAITMAIELQPSQDGAGTGDSRSYAVRVRSVVCPETRGEDPMKAEAPLTRRVPEQGLLARGGK